MLETQDGEECSVLESNVYLEIENNNGKRNVVHRTIRGARDSNLISVIDGPALSEPGQSYSSSDYFVNLSGAASREAGFHRFLSKFLGYELPVVQTYEGNEYPLYLQCIFPYAIVEQIRGWSSINPPVPTQFRIRDVHKRVIEFLLNLDAHKIAARRQELIDDRRRVESEWKTVCMRVDDLAEAVSGVVQGIPERPVITWPPQNPPMMMLPRNEQWIPIADFIADEEAELETLVGQEIPRVQEIASAAEQELANTERELRVKHAILSRRLGEIDTEEYEINSLKHRIATLEEDIQRNKDVQTLQQLGSQVQSSVGSGSCPICHQQIQDSLVPLDDDQSVMSVADNIKFLAEQRRTYQGVLNNTQQVQELRQRRAVAGREELNTLRQRIRSLRTTLISDGRVPSAAAIQSRLELEQRLHHHTEAFERFSSYISGFDHLSDQWKEVQAQLRALPKDDTSQEDKNKLSTWSRICRQQLEQFGFRSLTIEQISISSDTYRPEHEGFDLQTSISASDLIRTIWAYLYGLLEVSRTLETNHPGFIIFDEPRQQSAKDVSFKELLTRASNATSDQVIFFTSENFDRLTSALDGISHTLRPYDGRVITPHE
tara:strand:+ start:29316 stop:31124 length:1809 start_codon:yes stop_codon:yes gene_type:complete